MNMMSAEELVSFLNSLWVKAVFEEPTYRCPRCRDTLYEAAKPILHYGISYSRVSKCEGGFCQAWNHHRDLCEERQAAIGHPTRRGKDDVPF